MIKLKNICKRTLSYIASRKLLKYSIIIILLFIPTGAVLTNKFFNNNKEKIQQQVSDTKDKSKNVTSGNIKTDVKKDNNISRHTLSDGFESLSETNSSNKPSSNKTNSASNTSSRMDKSSLSGIDLDILEGHEFNPKKDLKLKATDKNGSDISDNIIIEKNTVNTTNPGNYTVRASVRLSDGQKKEKEFTVAVKETRLDVALESFKPVKEMAKKGEKIVFDLDLNVSKNHVTPTLAMINGKEYTLYKGEERIFDKLTNKKRYKVIINASDIAGVQQFNLEHVKMSNGSWISLGENIANVEVLKEVASVKNFTYEEQSIYKRVKAKFNLEDIDNTASNLKLEFYKDNELVKTEILDKKSEYEVYLPTTSNGKYDFKVLADINLTQGIAKNNASKKAIFTTTLSVSNINQSSLIGKDAEIVQGDKFNPVKDLSLKATDFDGENITDKIVVEDNNLDTNIVGKQNISVYVVNKRNQKYSKQFNVTVKPIAEVIEFNPTKDEFGLDENVSFEVKLKFERNNAVADKAIINGEVVNLVPDKFKNSFGNIKTYSAELNGESNYDNKKYSLSKIIMKDGKEFTLNKDTIVKVLNSDVYIDSQDEPSLSRMLFSNNNTSNHKMISSRFNGTVSGNDTETIVHNVKVSGTVTKSDGNSPAGKIQVELPTAMAFTVDQNGNFNSATYTVSNKSSVGISVSVSEFRDTNQNSGITVKPISEDISSLDRSNLHLALVGNNGKYVDLGDTITDSKELLDVKASNSSIIQLLGESGKAEVQEVDDNGAKEDFTLVFKIKKKN